VSWRQGCWFDFRSACSGINERTLKYDSATWLSRGGLDFISFIVSLKMLDSPPVALPPIRRPLKRSASTASLPTPPRSYRKLARGKSRGSCDSDNASTTVGSTTSPPVTPKTRPSTRRALRDSPDNPFLATPSHSDSSADPSPHGPLQERPTIAYVLYVSSLLQIYITVINDLLSRGVRRECKNPLYNHAQDRPFSPPPESKLDIDHPDYSPSIHCIPKRLFPEAHSKRKKQKKPSISSKKQDPLSRKRARQRSPSLSADEDDVGEIRPLKLDFGSAKKRAGGGPTLDQEEL
jgi:hypothetical protein